MILIKTAVIDPESGFDQVADVLVKDKKIIRIAQDLEEEDADVIDASNMIVAPGLIDIHVHFREPGQTHGDDNTARWLYDSSNDGKY